MNIPVQSYVSTAEKATAAAFHTLGRGASLVGQYAKATGKALVGQDDFTQKVVRQAKASRAASKY